MLLLLRSKITTCGNFKIYMQGMALMQFLKDYYEG